MDNRDFAKKPWYKRNWLKLVIALAIAVILVRIPATRNFIIWLLPIGGNWVDIVQGVLLALIVVVLYVKGFLNIPNFFRWLKK